MAASISDLFTYVAYGTLTHLASPGYTIGNSSINGDDLSEWPTPTAVYFSMDRIDSAGLRIDDSYTSWKGIVSGNTIGSLDLQSGDDQDYPAGSSTRLFILDTSALWNALIDGLSVEHNKNGSHGAITATSVTTTGAVSVGTTLAVTGASTFTGAVTLPNATVSPSKLATGATSAFVATAETTTSISYVDLATTTDTVTVTTGVNGLALVSIYANLKNNTTTTQVGAGFAVSGSTTLAANDNQALLFTTAGANFSGSYGATYLVTGLTAGSNTFKMKYRVDAGTGTFTNRRISVVPL